MFAAQGIKFDAGGSLVSSARDTFEALIRIIDTKYSGMMDKLAGTTETKLATLTDKWQGALRIIGSKLITILTPFIEYFSSFLDKLTNSGALNMLVDRFMSPMTNMANAFGNGNMQQGLDRLLATVAAFVAEIPAMLEGVFKNVGIMFSNIMNQNRALMADAFPWVKDPKRAAYNQEAMLLRRADINQRAAFDQIIDPKTAEQYAESARRFKTQMAQLDAQYGYNGNNDIMAGTTWSKMGERIQTTISKTLEMIGNANLPSSATAGVQGVGPYGTIAETGKATADESNDLLLRIAKNTKDSADALTLRRETLGGGTMGAIGLTGAEVAAVSGSYGMFGNGLIPAGTDLERAMRRIIRDESRRNGQPGVMGRF
jgi:hypothetical protein